MGNFFHLTNRQETSEENRRHGEFHLILEAPDQKTALAMFKKRIQDFRKTGSLFEGKCRIYLTKTLEFDKIPDDEAVIVNFRSVAGDPLMPFIDCSIPTDENDNCTVMEWNDEVPETEGLKGELFLEFRSDRIE